MNSSPYEGLGKSMDEFQKQLNDVAKQVRLATIPFEAISEISRSFADKFPKPEDLVSKELRSVMKRMAKLASEQSEMHLALSKSITPQAFPTINVAPIVDSLAKMVIAKQITDLLETGHAQPAADYIPENWRGAKLAPASVFEIANEGWVVTSVPSSSTLEALVAAADRFSRRGVHQHELSLITQFTTDQLARQESVVKPLEFDLIMKSLSLLTHGDWKPAQTMSSVIFDSRMSAFVRDLQVPNLRFPGNVWGMLEALITNHSSAASPLSDLHGFVAFILSSREAWRPYHYDLGYEGEHYNRHASIHRPNAAQYNEVNALVATMLATAAVLSYAQLQRDVGVRVAENLTVRKPGENGA